MAVISFLAILHWHGRAVVHEIKSYEQENKRTEMTSDYDETCPGSLSHTGCASLVAQL